VVVNIGTAIFTNTFHIRLQRPGFYRIDWSQPIGNATYSKGVVWSAGDGNFMETSAGGNVLAPAKMENRRIALASATGLSSLAAATIPGLFFAENFGDALQLAASGSTKLTKEPDAKIGDVDCHVFTGTFDPAKLPGGGKLPNNMGSAGTSTTTFWIGKKDHLQHQVRQVVDTSHTSMPTMSDEAIKNVLTILKKPVTPEAVAAMKTQQEATAKLLAQNASATFIQTHENIIVNQKFSAADFAR
jgi:hypothetical protein